MFLFLLSLQTQAKPSYDEEGNTSFASYSSKNTFIELNIGLASLGGYDFSYVALPGASLLYGGTFSNYGLVYELQLGAALPTLFTAKVGIGVGNTDRYLMFAARPWPLTIGPQVKIEQWTFSLEFGTADESSFHAGLIGTVGYRWIFE